MNINADGAEIDAATDMEVYGDWIRFVDGEGATVKIDPYVVKQLMDFALANKVEAWKMGYEAAKAAQRQWVGLTEEEIMVIGDKVANEDLVGLVSNFRVRLARAVEQTLKEKNHG